MFRAVPIALLALLLGCSSGPGRAPTTGEAYVGPATLKLRQELGPRAAETATLKHGDRVEIIQRRRRFVKVRTVAGAEGWTDLGQLLTPAQMSQLNRLARRAAELPSQGAATVLGALNVHTDPHRQAPSFYRIREGELVDVIDHRVAARTPYETQDLAPPPSQPPRKSGRSKDDELRLPQPPPPRPPKNWLPMSGWTPIPEPPKEQPAAKPVPLDDWNLVRLPDGRVGWALSAMLRMNIPDEVAQYSEGRRITSYFSLGEVDDNGQIKRHWLWTTSSKANEPYDFDSFRYFRWSLRSHRYETAYIERHLKGYYPVTLHPVQVGAGRRPRTMSGFSLTVEEADGTRYRRTYVYESYVVRLVSKTRLAEPGSSERTGWTTR
jgi:hypothetical protein